MNLVKDEAVEISVLYTNSPPPPDPNEDITKRNSQPALMRGLVIILDSTYQHILKQYSASV